jgi:hypothetical protein
VLRYFLAILGLAILLSATLIPDHAYARRGGGGGGFHRRWPPGRRHACRTHSRRRWTVSWWSRPVCWTGTSLVAVMLALRCSRDR